MLLSQPTTTAAARQMVRVLERFDALSKRAALSISALLLVLLLAADYLTGRNVNIGIAYTMLICFTAWTLGERPGIVMTIIVAIGMSAILHVRVAIDPAVHLVPLTTEVWNTASRTLTGLFVAILVSGLRTTLRLERWRAETDGLTGVLNKSAFRRRMAAAFDHARRTDRALMLAYMDLDGFKGVNDQHGHSAGDRVLTAFAHAAAGAIRTRDLFARIGGDEFVVLMTVPDCDRGDSVAEMLYDRLSGILQETGFAVTCSMGALVMRTDDVDPQDDFIAMADALMYEVKRAGKNALRIARHQPVGDRLREAFPPVAITPFEALLARIDRAESAITGRKAA